MKRKPNPFFKLLIMYIILGLLITYIWVSYIIFKGDVQREHKYSGIQIHYIQNITI